MPLTLEAFRRATGRRYPCRLAAILDELGPKDRSVLEAALADKAVSDSAISKILTAAEHPISEGQVGHHRHGGQNHRCPD